MSMMGDLFAVPATLLEELKTSAEARAEWLGDTSELDTHGLDEKWHALHYLVCGAPGEVPGPLGSAVMGGKALSAEDMGYGPARYLLPEEVAAIAAALEGVTHEELSARFDPARMDAIGIYPTQTDRDLDDLLERFDALRSYYVRAAKAGLAMLSWLS